MTPSQALKFAEQSKRFIPDATVEGFQFRVRDLTVQELADIYRVTYISAARTITAPEWEDAARERP